MKYFQHPLATKFFEENLRRNFNFTHICKPASSRSESNESYWYCAGWKGI